MKQGIYHGDCLDLLSENKDEQFDLIYADPPYNTGEVFKMSRSDEIAYTDIWPDNFYRMLKSRLWACARVLKSTGTCWIHLDHRTVHDVKGICDEVFGKYQGEIIWVPGNGPKSRRRIGMTHQTILVYSTGKPIKYYAERARESFAQGSLDTHFRNVDEEGRRYRDRTVNGKTYRYYADEGKKLGTVWTDCPAMAANSPICGETTGYPTQKPLSLLTRIIELTTDTDDLVLDPFCGSGTTLVAAHKLGRRWVGIDKSEVAYRVTSERLSKEQSVPAAPRSLELQY